MLQNLTKGKMVEWVVLLVALVALGLSIAAVAKPCSSKFGNTCTGPDCKVAGKKCDRLSDCGTIKQQMGCYCTGGGPATCSPLGGDCPHNAKCCTSPDEGGDPRSKCINDTQGNPVCVVPGSSPCVEDDKPCKPSDTCCSGSPCPNGGICTDGSGPPPSLDTLCPGTPPATTKQDCHRRNCHWSSEFGACLKDKLPSGKSPPSHRDECEEKYGDECSLDGEHPYYSCCKREKIYDKNNEFKKLGKSLHCKQSDAPGLPGLRCLYPNEGKKGTIGGDPGSLPPGLRNIGGWPGSTENSNGSGNGGTPSPSPSPSPGPGGGGKKSSDLPLILGLSGGGLVIVLAIAFLLMKRK